MGVSKTHHLVPRHWLRAFAEDGHVLGRWRDGAEYRTPLRAAAAARHFNSDPLAAGERRTVLETYLGNRVDTPLALVMRKVRQGHWPLEDWDGDTLLEGLAWQLVRTRAFRAWDEQVGGHLFPPPRPSAPPQRRHAANRTGLQNPACICRPPDYPVRS
ncbi:DUF4238 domain-containing protein [Streptomyces sp. NPDC016845]|uniref:DUF4238 domain-containing protein n=1 Tax=Streptomyces sp. NPDC016845 TaxID=3364972 RepID=UPI0037A8305D